ncbi:MAG: hypothetical protein K0Q90_1468 [Paenibacillaceae bacterium]|jgi:hypothetical protein|nr:hypothetical protein [Paenibacillaceae bacterium]
MHALVQDALSYMNSQLELIEKSLALLPEEKLWAKPGPELNSPGNYCLHLAGNEYQHFVTAVGGKPLIRQRSQEFTTAGGMNREELLQLLKGVRQESAGILGTLTEEDLSREVFVPYQSEDWQRMKPGATVEEETGDRRLIRTLLVRVPAHYGYHTGQIVLLSKILTGASVHLTGLFH